jgi:uncharacterized protein GlcG (DUF336 family)
VVDFLERAQRAVEAGLVYAREHELKMTFVVVDGTTEPVAAARMDGARLGTWDIAVAKANTAFRFQSPTIDLKGRIVPENKAAIQALMSRIVFLGGGVPIVENGRVVGAIGASGGVEDQDVESAAACLSAFGA